MIWRTPRPSDVRNFQYSNPVAGHLRRILFRRAWNESFKSRPRAPGPDVRVITRNLRRFAWWWVTPERRR